MLTPLLFLREPLLQGKLVLMGIAPEVKLCRPSVPWKMPRHSNPMECSQQHLHVMLPTQCTTSCCSSWLLIHYPHAVPNLATHNNGRMLCWRELPSLFTSRKHHGFLQTFLDTNVGQLSPVQAHCHAGSDSSQAHLWMAITHLLGS